jgi:hypothetical protein
MKKFVLTGKFDGRILVWYQDGVLVKISYEEAVMTEKQRVWFKAAVAVNEEGLMESLGGHFVVVEEFEEVQFIDFYKAFDNKVGKIRAEGVWKRMSKADQLKAYMYIPRYKTWLKTNPGVGQLHPVTYLNAKRWED